MSIFRIIGLVLLVVGVIILALGVFNLISYNSSTGGKIANSFAKAFGARTNAVTNYIVQICIGAGCAVVGYVIYKRS